jgi:glutamate/aspartate transport system substrate-binding protein
MTPSLFLSRSVIALSLILCATPGIVKAQAGGTLGKIKNTGAITLGMRESSGALSFAAGDGTYGGFHAQMAEQIVKDIQKQLRLSSIYINRVPVTSQNRIPMLNNGTIDLECGATANNIDRQRNVAFAMTTYVEELRIVVKRASDITSVAQLDKKTVAMTRGTNSIKVLRDAATTAGVTYSEALQDSHAQAFALLHSDQANAFVMDAQIIAALIAGTDNPSAYRILDKVLAVEPIACMLRKDDPSFLQAVNESIQRQITDGSLDKLYNQWFMERPIPPGNRPLAWPASVSTRTAWSKPNSEPMEHYQSDGKLELTQKAIIKSMESSNSSSSVSQNATADGFEFTVTPQSGVALITATGGPCSSTGITGMSFTSGQGVPYLKGTLHSDYYFTALGRSRVLPINTITHISPSTDWSSTVAENKKQFRGSAPGSQERELYRESFEQAECMARSHMQYVNAIENWIKSNLKLLYKLQPSLKEFQNPAKN